MSPGTGGGSGSNEIVMMQQHHFVCASRSCQPVEMFASRVASCQQSGQDFAPKFSLC